jgi:hypothetical protein
MQYMLLIYSEEGALAAMTQARIQAVMGAFQAFTGALVAAGAMVSGDRLQPTASATTVRASGGEVQIHDGPFGETKEQLGGYYVIEAPDLDAALAWAKQCPAIQYGSVEVRPVFEMPQA